MRKKQKRTAAYFNLEQLPCRYISDNIQDAFQPEKTYIIIPINNKKTEAWIVLSTCLQVQL